jgi:broad specificity phosphatase PhoE
MGCRMLFIRHGETVWNQERRCQGFTDVPLSDRGDDQASALALALKGARLDAVYSSDLVRARRTAEVIAEPHRILVKSDARLREMNQGALEGKNLEGLLSSHPELLKKWMREPAEVEMPRGESMRSVQARAWQAVKEITGRHHDGLVAVVSHNLCILSIICKAINLDLNHFRRLRMENASISEIEFGSHGPVLCRINDTAHLNNHRGR